MRTQKTAARWIALTASIALAVTLTACSSEETPEVSPTSAPTPSASPSATDQSSEPAEPTSSPDPSASETPAQIDLGNIASWRIDASGIGPMKIGAEFDEVLKSLPAEAWTHDDFCDWAAFANPSDEYTAYFLRGPEAAQHGTVILAAVAATEATADGPRDSAGIGLGSSRTEVLEAYPDAKEAKPSAGLPEEREFLVVSSSDAKTFFAFDGDSDVVAVFVTTLPEPPYEACG